MTQEGSGSAVMSGYVEIIFDNSDDRFPTGKPELVLRRTIGLKKDEYSLDRKNATKADVMNLLESAGFSRSNPYYIVPQGRVTTLTNMKDAERLNLLKEVAGTQVYEARRTESLKIMTETDNKRSKIDDLLAYIKDRLDELEEEKEELREYQEKDRERRCLEYTIYHREQTELQRTLEAIDEQRQTGVDETDDNREAFLAGEQELKDIDDQINLMKQQMDFLRLEKRQLDDERRDAARDKAKIELDVRTLTEGQSAAQAAKARHDQELSEVQNLIHEREAELNSIMPDYSARLQEESNIRSQLNEAEGTRQRLYAKQGRTARFKSKQERDAWLQKEINEVNVALTTRKAVSMQTDEDIGNLESGVETLNSQVTQLRSRIDNQGDHVMSISEEVQKAKEERERLMDQRKELWRQEAKIDSAISGAQQELERAERSLSHMMDQDTSRGLASVRRIKRQHNLDGVYGTLAELFQVSDKYRTAVEVTAGASLFHYVVDTDQTASKVVEILQKEKGGRVTFMPLNRLRPKPVNIPKASDAVHMISKLEYDPTYENAFQQVFGKTIICPNLQVASQYARSHAISAITPDGDRADKKGALTGGFHDPRQSRLEGVRNVLKRRAEYDDHRSSLDEIRKSLETHDQKITRAVGDLQKAEQKRMQLENNYGPLRQELRNMSLDLQGKQDDLDKKRRAKGNLDSAVNELDDQLSAYQSELASEFRKALSQQEEQQLEQLGSTVQALRKQYADLSAARSDLEARKTVIEVELRENLRMRLDQVNAQEFETLGGNGTGGNSTQLKERQRELKRISKAFEELEEKLHDAESNIDQATSQMAEYERRKVEIQKSQGDIAKAIERHQKRMEKSMAKKALLTEKAAECSRNIRDLGVLPEEAFQKYENMDSDKASILLQTALDWYTNELCVPRLSSAYTRSTRLSRNTHM